MLIKYKQSILRGAAAVALAALVTVQAGCSMLPKQKNPNAAEHFFNMEWINEKMGSTPVVATIQNETGLPLEITKSTGANGEELRKRIAAGSLPDIVTVYKSDPIVTELIDSGLVLDLGEAFKQFAPEAEKFYDLSGDGKYYIPNFVVSDEDLSLPGTTVLRSVQMNYIRSDIYNALGKPDMSTPETFATALSEIKAKNPDLYPWYIGPKNTESVFASPTLFGYLAPMAQFGVTVRAEDGTSGLRTAEFKNYIAYMNGLYRNGLIADASMADDDILASSVYEKAKAAVITTSDLFVNERFQISGMPDIKWTPLPMFEGAKYALDGSGWLATFVSKDSPHVERIIKAIAYLSSDAGRRLAAWGMSGVHWDIREADGIKFPVYIGSWEQMRSTDWGGMTRTEGMTLYTPYLDYRTADMINVKPNLTAYESNLRDIALKAAYIDKNGNWGVPAGMSAVEASALEAMFAEYYPKMIMAPSEDEAMKMYDEFISKADAGLKIVEAAWKR